jgi:hypothetical protein
MIAGLTWTAWLLIVASVLPGLLMALAFYMAHRNDVPPPRVPTDPT